MGKQIEQYIAQYDGHSVSIIMQRRDSEKMVIEWKLDREKEQQRNVQIGKENLKYIKHIADDSI